METRPLITIVVPTTRPHYLKWSVQSLLDQTFGEFEILVVFNPLPGSDAELDLPSDPRIRVIRQPSFQTIHDNWESGFANARGEWVAMLGDDDVYIPAALSIFASTAAANPDTDMILWRWGGFNSMTFPHPLLKGRAHIPGFEGKIETKTTANVKSILYGFDPDSYGIMKRWLPSIMRGAVRTRYVHEARARSGAFCYPLTPDYGAGAQILALATSITLIDYPLMILNHTADSNAASAVGAQDFRDKNLYGVAGHPRFVHSPVQGRYETNRALIFETLMAIREIYKDEYADTPIDIVRFLNWYYAGLMEAKSLTTDITYALKDLDEAISRLGEADQKRIRDLMHKRDVSPNQPKVRSWKGEVLKAVEQVLTRIPATDGLMSAIATRYGIDIHGPRSGFADILAFGRYSGRIVARRSGP